MAPLSQASLRFCFLVFSRAARGVFAQTTVISSSLIYGDVTTSTTSAIPTIPFLSNANGTEQVNATLASILSTNGTQVTIASGNATVGTTSSIAWDGGYITYLGKASWQEIATVSSRIKSSPEELIVVVSLIFIVLFLCFSREYWFPTVYEKTFSRTYCPKMRNIPAIGWCCSKVCFCCYPKYFAGFRLRVVVHQGFRMKGNAVYVVAKCGNNPVKTTSMQRVPMSPTVYPVVWNEPLDLDVHGADDAVTLEVITSDREVLGRVSLVKEEFLSQMTSDVGDKVRYLKHGVQTKDIIQGKTEAGQLQLSLYITELGQTLPESLQPLV